MKTENSNSIKRFPTVLYLLFVCIWRYSVEDMATSTNSYQEQGLRTMVYFFLVASILLMGIYVLLNKYSCRAKPVGSVLLIVAWLTMDNLLIGNFFNGSQWTCFTHIGIVVWWFLAIQSGYIFIKSNQQNEKHLIFLIMLMFVYYCYQFFNVYFVSNANSDTQTVLNLIYRVIVFVPYLYFLKSGKLRKLLVCVVCLMTFLSMKRGAIIVLPLMLLALNIDKIKNERNFVRKIVVSTAVVIAVIVVYKVIDNKTGGFLSYRLSEEQLIYASERGVKYATAWDEIKSRMIIDVFLGVGSIKKSGVHNELLEFLYSFGIIGLLLYITFLVKMASRYFELKRVNSRFSGNYLSVFLFFAVVGLYSGVFFTHSTFYLALYIGMIEAKTKN